MARAAFLEWVRNIRLAVSEATRKCRPDKEQCVNDMKSVNGIHFLPILEALAVWRMKPNAREVAQ